MAPASHMGDRVMFRFTVSRKTFEDDEKFHWRRAGHAIDSPPMLIRNRRGGGNWRRAGGPVQPGQAAPSTCAVPADLDRPERSSSVHFARSPHNPIIVPGGADYRKVCTFNPGVLLDDDGKFYL